MQVECKIEEVEVENERGFMQAAMRATCGECGHCEDSFGTSEKSTKRSLIMLKENCPRDEKNFYVEE